MPNPLFKITGKRLPTPFQNMLLICMLEACVVFALTKHLFLPAVLLHLAAAFIAMRNALRDRMRGEDMKLSLLFALLILTTGPFGAFCSLLTLLFYSRFARVSLPFLTWFSALYPEQETEEHLRVYDRIVLGLENRDTDIQVEPFRDILAGGSVPQKQAVITKMMRYFTPAYTPLLRQALEDKENAVRVHAATALAKLDRDYMKRYLQAEKDYASAPQNMQKLRTLASVCDAYANSGIADQSSGQVYLHKAIAYTKILCENGHEAEFFVELGRLYRQAGELEASRNCLEKCLHETPTPSPEIILSYMETLYQMGRFEKVRECAERYRHKMSDAAETLPQCFTPWMASATQQAA